MTMIPRPMCPRCGRPMVCAPLIDAYSGLPLGEIRVCVHLRCNRCDIVERRSLWYEKDGFERMMRDGTIVEVVGRDLTALLEREPLEDPSRWRRLVNRLRGRV